MLVKELLEKLDTSSEIDLIEIICNGESKIKVAVKTMVELSNGLL